MNRFVTLAALFAIILILARDTHGQKPERIVCFGETSDGKMLAAEVEGKEIHIRTFPAGDVLKTIKTEQEGIFDIEYSLDSKLIASLDSKSLVVYDTASGKEIRKIKADFTKEEELVLNDKLVAAYKIKPKVIIRKWEIATGKEVKD